MLARCDVLAAALILAGCTCGRTDRASSGPCPDGAERTGNAPPTGTRQWCQKLGEDRSFVRHGPWTEWYPSGQKMTAGEYVDGERHGPWVRWYATGQQAWAGEFDHGKRTGVWLRWDEDGRKVAEARFEQGVPVAAEDGGRPPPAAAFEAPDGGTNGPKADDQDGDWLLSDQDNCPHDANPTQSDLDQDGLGDACDDDRDGDKQANAYDNCPDAPNPDQSDRDFDHLGDACDDDLDGDGVANAQDNCPALENAEQVDADGDGEGDACDRALPPLLDSDGDGFPDPGPNAGPLCSPLRRTRCYDNCPGTPNPDQGYDACHIDRDTDGDGVRDLEDNCHLVPNPDQKTSHGQPPSEGGDACWMDMDGDGVKDMADNCPLLANPGQENADGLFPGDACSAKPWGDALEDAPAPAP